MQLFKKWFTLLKNKFQLIYICFNLIMATYEASMEHLKAKEAKIEEMRQKNFDATRAEAEK